MDPNTALDEIRQLVKSIQLDSDRDRALDPADVDRLTELVSGLDSWLSSGGFLPKPWHPDLRPARRLRQVGRRLVKEG